MKRFALVLTIIVSLSVLSGIVWNSDINPFVMAGNIKQNAMTNDWHSLNWLRQAIEAVEFKYSDPDTYRFHGKDAMTPEDRAKYLQMLSEREMLWEKVGITTDGK